VFPRDAIAAAIESATGKPVRATGHQAVGGGCINQAVRLGTDAGDYFVKFNDASALDMFEAEAEGLEEIARSGTLRVPRPVCHGVEGGTAYLVLDWLALGAGNGGALERLGEGLAAMHQVTRDRYGWHRDNTIGSTPQVNTEHPDWVSFWRDRRLGYQLALAARNGFGGHLRQAGEELMDRLDGLFAGYVPAPALLHGDLWSGNYAVTRNGEPVVFDPAVYFGDREADLAMTELFGGFGERFYGAYRAAYPLDPGYPVRRRLYNLYHVLNHANLFGGGYAGQAQRMIEGLLSELR